MCQILIFVSFKKQSHVSIVIAGQSNIFVRIFKTIFSAFFPVTSTWRFQRAPEPSDIFWENLEVGDINRFFRFCYLLSIQYFVIISVYMILLLI